MRQQQQLLDDLDEARIVAKSYRRGYLWATLGATTSLLMILASAVVGMWSTAAKVDFGGQAAMLGAVGIVGMLASVGAGCWWFDYNNADRSEYRHKRIPSPAARLRAAERAYRNHVMEQ